MLKYIYRLKKTLRTVAFFVVLAVTASGCGSNSKNSVVETPEVQSQNAMKSAFSYLHQTSTQGISTATKADYLNSALAQTIKSYELNPNQEALLVKAFIQIGLNKTADAEATLDKVDAEYPGKSEDEFIRACLNAQENRDPAVIAGYLQESMNDSFSGMDEVLWWGLLEKLPAFATFRTTVHFQNLLSMKSVAKQLARSSSYVCKENYTAYKNHWYGMEIRLSNNDVAYLEGTGAVGLAISAFGIFLANPIVFGILAAYFIAEDAAVELVNINGNYCGVSLHNTWLTLPILIPTPQK